MADAHTHRVTIIDVARRADVAISSASAALNGRPGVSEATRERILRTAEDLHYVPSLRARSLSSNRAFTVGLVVQREIGVLETDPFFGAFIGGVEEVLEPRGYALVLQISEDPATTADRYRLLAANRRVDGVFIDEIHVNDSRTDLLTELGLPAVAINPGPHFPFPAVRQDAVSAIHALTQHLIDLGHTRIAHVAGPTGFVHSVQRRKAWRETLTGAGLRPGSVVVGDFSYAGGASAARKLMDSPTAPTAVVCANDLMAAGFIGACQEMGLRVPEDVSVTGFDDIALSTYIHPQLTTARTLTRTVGSHAATMLLDLIEGAEVHDDAVEPASPIFRESTTSPRN